MQTGKKTTDSPENNGILLHSMIGGAIELDGLLLTAPALRGAELGDLEDTIQTAKNFENMMG